ncbi:unnamed protein product, partial [Amoebophrya sp. A25]
VKCLLSLRPPLLVRRQAASCDLKNDKKEADSFLQALSVDHFKIDGAKYVSSV